MMLTLRHISVIILVILFTLDFGKSQSGQNEPDNAPQNQQSSNNKDYVAKHADSLEGLVGNYKDVQKVVSSQGVMEADHIIPEKTIKDAIESNKDSIKNCRGRGCKQKRQKLKKNIKKLNLMLKNQITVSLLVETHRQTESHGSKGEAIKFRQDVTNLLASGKFEEAIDRGVKTYKNKFGDSKDESLKRVVQSYQQKGIISQKSGENILKTNGMLTSTVRSVSLRSDFKLDSSASKWKATRDFRAYVKKNEGRGDRISKATQTYLDHSLNKK